MRINYHFVVEHQTLTLESYESVHGDQLIGTNTPVTPVVGDKNCIWAVFHVDCSWAQDKSVKAIFKKATQSIIMDVRVCGDNALECQIPWEVMQTADEFLVGLRTDAGINTTAVSVRPRYACQYEGKPDGYSVEDWISRVDRVTEEAVNAANEVKQAADSGRFDGTDGDSAYQLAVKHGFQGTEAEWLQKLAYDHSDEFEALAHQVAADAAKTKQDADRANQEALAAKECAQRAEAAAASTEQALDEREIAMVDKLAPPFHETAPIVHGKFVAGHPLGVVSHIRPVQEGEGAPNPTNVRPIHGWSAVDLTATNTPDAPKAEEKRTKQFPEEVFGGAFDWNTGVLTKWHKYQANAADVSYVESSQPHGDRIDLIIDSIKAITGLGYCEALKYKTIIGADYKFTCNIRNIKSGVTIGIHLPKGTLETADVSGARKWISEHKNILNFFFPVENGDTSLDKETVTSLSGTTTLYSNTGDTEVTGRLDPNAVISGMMDRIAALEKLHTQM